MIGLLLLAVGVVGGVMFAAGYGLRQLQSQKRLAGAELRSK